MKMLLHSTAVSIKGRGVLLIGKSGSGKSDLALRLIHMGATLIADDQVEVKPGEDSAYLNAPENIKGMLEIRGVGIISMETQQNIPLALVIALDKDAEEVRMPELSHYKCLGQDIPMFSFNSFHASTPLKIIAAMNLIA